MQNFNCNGNLDFNCCNKLSNLGFILRRLNDYIIWKPSKDHRIQFCKLSYNNKIMEISAEREANTLE